MARPYSDTRVSCVGTAVPAIPNLGEARTARVERTLLSADFDFDFRGRQQPLLRAALCPTAALLGCHSDRSRRDSEERRNLLFSLRRKPKSQARA